MKHRVKTAKERLFDLEFIKLMKGVKKIKPRTWNVPRLRMIIKLKRGIKIQTYIKNYLIDRYHMNSVFGRRKSM